MFLVSQLQALLKYIERRLFPAAGAGSSRLSQTVSNCSALPPHMEIPMPNGGRVRETFMIIDEDPYLLRREDVASHVNQLVSALAEDNSDEFLRVAKDRLNLVSEGSVSYVIAPSLMLRWAIYYRAFVCAKVLLAGEGGYDLRASVHTKYFEMPPLHLAAAELLPDFVALFLKRGASVFERCMYRGANFYFMLPLNIAIEKLSEKILWTPTQSVYRLIFTLCCTVQLEQAFRTISQLMGVSSLKENQEAIYHYASEGKIVELSIFLYVDAISEFGIFKSWSYEEHLALSRFLTTNSSSQSKEEIIYVVDGNGGIESMDKKCVMTSLLLLFQIFYQTNFSMLGFNDTSEILAKRIKDAGFDWMIGDLENLGNNVAATEAKHQKKCGLLPGGPFNILPMGAQCSQPWLNSVWGFHEMRGISSAAQTFQASQSFGSRLMPMLFTQRDTQAGARKAISHGGHLALSSSLRKMWPIFYSAIRRTV